MKICRFVGGLFILLVTLVSPGAASTIHDAAKLDNLEQVQRLTLDGVDVNERAQRDEHSHRPGHAHLAATRCSSLGGAQVF